MKVLCVGAAACVWGDVARALALFKPDAFIAVNDAIPLWGGRLHHAATMHGEYLDRWLQERADNGHSPPEHLWTAETRAGRAKNIKFETVRSLGGSSGLLAVRVARKIGATKIVLAGIPMARDCGHVRRKIPWDAAKLYQKDWVREQDLLRVDVRSMSGLTAALFTEPTKEWINEQDTPAAYRQSA